jgi:hypothetical protein
MKKQSALMRSLLLSRLVTLFVVLLAVGASGTATARSQQCSDSYFASGELVVRGVSCEAGKKVILRALKRPPCTPSREDAQLGRGCYGSNRVGKWRCSGLFPGEGFDLKCRSGKRRIHGGAGG